MDRRDDENQYYLAWIKSNVYSSFLFSGTQIVIMSSFVFFLFDFKCARSRANTGFVYHPNYDTENVTTWEVYYTINNVSLQTTDLKNLIGADNL